MPKSSVTTRGCNLIVSRNLSRIMQERGISRRRLSNDLNIKYTTICDWVKGHSVPRVKSLSLLAGYFGISESDFFIDTSESSDATSRLNKYKEELVLNLSTVEFMTDEQIRELINRGFSFKHRSLEEYIAISGKPLKASPEIDFGEPGGDEIW